MRSRSDDGRGRKEGRDMVKDANNSKLFCRLHAKEPQDLTPKWERN